MHLRFSVSVLCALLAINLIGCSSLIPELSRCPTSMGAESSVLAAQWRNGDLSATGIAFFGDSFFVSTNRGILVFSQDGEATSVLKCRVEEGDVFEGLFVEQSGPYLWTYDYRGSQFLRSDGSEWVTIGMPRNGDATRGELNSRFNFLETSEGLWAFNASGIWAFDQKDLGWKPVRLPALPCQNGAAIDCLASVVLIENSPVVISHSQPPIPGIHPPLTESDSFTYRVNGVWAVPEKVGGLWTVTTLSGKRGSFVQASENSLFFVDKRGIKSLPPMGNVRGLSLTSDDHLIVYFEGLGVYEFDPIPFVWKKLLDPISDPLGPRDSMVMAERNGKVVLSVNSYDLKGMHTVSSLWISEGLTLRRLTP